VKISWNFPSLIIKVLWLFLVLSKKRGGLGVERWVGLDGELGRFS
jgi:hypothetical protein